jgi:hypothetical protein
MSQVKQIKVNSDSPLLGPGFGTAVAISMGEPQGTLSRIPYRFA